MPHPQLTPHGRFARAGRARLAAVVAAGAFPLLLAGCEAEAVELVQEIQAARQDCSRDELRASAEDCVRMMEEYAGMGTELVHTYLGGLRALDAALDRMPPPEFDSGEMGYALSPEFRQGDAMGAGSSPRLSPTQPAYSYGAPSPSASRSRGAGPASAPGRVDRYGRGADYAYGTGPVDRYGRGAEYPYGAGTVDRYGREIRREAYGGYDHDGRYDPSGRYGRDGGYDRYDRYGRVDRTDGYRSYREQDRWRRADPRAADARERSLRREALEDLRWFDLPGYGSWDALRLLDPYASGPGYAPFGYGTYDRYAFGGYGPYGTYDPYGYGGYGSYGYGGYGSYGYGGYDPYGYGGDPRYTSGAYADPRWAGGYVDYGADARYDRDSYVEPRSPGGSAAGRTPAEEWGYEPDRAPVADAYPSGAGDEDRGEDGAPPPADAGAARPAPQRPGILLPPEQRLRRPWLDD